MAGGPLAQNVPCMVCLMDDDIMTKAVRVSEGAEADKYRCEKGHTFSMDFPRGPATEPSWPPPPELGGPPKR